MRRREFITVLGGASAWPLVGHAQQPERVRRVGVLMSIPENDPIAQRRVTIVAQALGRFGWVEGKNIRIDYRFAASDPTLFKTYAAELVGLLPDAILATSSSAVAALRQQTRTIPVVFTPVADPVGQGFVQSLARPGGNLTGFSSNGAELMGKWVQLLKEVAPRVLCHEHHRSKRRCGTVREMKEGPSGSAIRSLIPSHRKLLWSKVTVVSVAETPGR